MCRSPDSPTIGTCFIKMSQTGVALEVITIIFQTESAGAQVVVVIKVLVLLPGTLNIYPDLTFRSRDLQVKPLSVPLLGPLLY